MEVIKYVEPKSEEIESSRQRFKCTTCNTLYCPSHINFGKSLHVLSTHEAPFTELFD